MVPTAQSIPTSLASPISMNGVSLGFLNSHLSILLFFCHILSTVNQLNFAKSLSINSPHLSADPYILLLPPPSPQFQKFSAKPNFNHFHMGADLAFFTCSLHWKHFWTQYPILPTPPSSIQLQTLLYIHLPILKIAIFAIFKFGNFPFHRICT